MLLLLQYIDFPWPQNSISEMFEYLEHVTAYARGLEPPPPREIFTVPKTFIAKRLFVLNC
jgi:hypothetical protein